MTREFGEESTGRVQHELDDGHHGLLPGYRVRVTSEIGDLSIETQTLLEDVLSEMYARLVALETGS